MTAPNIALKHLNVVELARVSTDKQDLTRQEFDLADNREKFGLNVLRTIRIKISGTKVLTNEDVQLMIEQLSHPGLDAVSCSAIDRLFRPEDFSFLLLQEFHKQHKAIISTKEGYVEPWTPEGWATCMRAVMQAGSELFEIKRRTKGGRRKAHAQNKPMNTCAPYGLLYIDKYSRDADGKSQYYIEDPAPSSIGISKREVVVMIFRWRYEERLKTYQIVRRLNERGILTGGKRNKDGSWQFEPGLWTRTTVIQLLQNKHYIGEHWEGCKKVDVPCPKFIDRDVFQAVQDSFVENKQNRPGRPTHKGLFSQFLVCARCKHKMYLHYRPRYPSYRCVHFDYKHLKRACNLKQIACHLVDPVAFALIWKNLTTLELLLENAKAHYDSLPSKGATAKLEKERTAVQGRIERMQDMVYQGTIDPDKGNAKILGDMKRLREIEADLRMAGSVVNLPPARLVESACRKIAEGRMPSTFDTQRPVLEKLVDLRVAYDGEYIEITGKVPVPKVSANRGQRCDRRLNAYPQA
jgi:DNA invertase Pin-like site-specific DNA recombinase